MRLSMLASMRRPRPRPTRAFRRRWVGVMAPARLSRISLHGKTPSDRFQVPDQVAVFATGTGDPRSSPPLEAGRLHRAAARRPVPRRRMGAEGSVCRGALPDAGARWKRTDQR